MIESLTYRTNPLRLEALSPSSALARLTQSSTFSFDRLQTAILNPCSATFNAKFYKQHPMHNEYNGLQKVVLNLSHDSQTVQTKLKVSSHDFLCSGSVRILEPNAPDSCRWKKKPRKERSRPLWPLCLLPRKSRPQMAL